MSPGEGAAGWSPWALAAASMELSDPGRMVRLSRGWPTGEGLLAAPAEEVCAVLRLTADRAAALAATVGNASPRVLETLAGRGVALVTEHDPDYPPLLRHTEHAPPLLWVRGDVGALARRAVAVVGARKASAYGREVAKAVATSAASAGFAVVSGAALGIDAGAHEAALAVGVTVAVLGSGVDVPYPRRHRDLLERICAAGCVISEFPPGTPALPYHFPLRNRVMAGMCERLVVVEAALRSGALITAGFAGDYGREVLAVPGSIWSAQSEGCHRLLADGAAPLIRPGDVLGHEPPTGGKEDESPREAWLGPVRGTRLVDEEGLRLLECIRQGADTPDRLGEASGLDPAGCAAAVSVLELAGVVVRDEGGGLMIRVDLP